MKRLAVTTVLVLAPLLWAPPSADASAPTCQGRTATIVGKPGKSLQGTSGPDVVVSGGASLVGTGDGNDVICLTGTTSDGYRAKLYSGDGDDSVVAGTGNPVVAYLGLGEDTYRGGDEVDDVAGGDPADDEFDSYEDEAADSITTGGGDDRVVASPADTISLGAGDDELQWGPTGKPFTGEAAGGAGRDLLQVTATGAEGDEPGSWLLDNRVGTFSRDGEVQMSWTGFSRFYVRVDAGVERLRMRGSTRAESFGADASPLSGTPITVDAGGGDDTVSAGGSATPGEIALDIDGGPGRDLVQVDGYEFVRASLLLDLAAGSYHYQDDEVTATIPLAGIEDAEVQGIPEVTVRGDSSANRLTVRADQTDFPVFRRCQIDVSGNGGDDRLTLLSKPVQASWKSCPAPVLRGQAGEDVLMGSLLGEKLLGGPGRDLARGGPGRDVCIAETRMGCER